MAAVTRTHTRSRVVGVAENTGTNAGQGSVIARSDTYIRLGGAVAGQGELWSCEVSWTTEDPWPSSLAGTPA